MTPLSEIELRNKYTELVAKLAHLDSLLIGFSGGVDSTLLAKAAKDASIQNVLLVTVHGAMVPDFEMEEVHTLANLIQVPHLTLTVDTDTIEGFNANSSERCYFCKKQIFTQIKEVALSHQITTVAEGSNLDDLKDYRPGAKAITELQVISPLLENGWSKAEIRDISRILGLPTHDKPNYACLASRIPFDEPITKERLKRVERSEDALRTLGFKQFRVRDHNTIARIEIATNEMHRLFDVQTMEQLSKTLKTFGYTFVTLDLEGYAIGRLSAQREV